MISVDVETTGIFPKENSILSIGAVDMANPENRFYGECRAWDGAVIAEDALKVNGFTMEQATDPNRMSEAELMARFVEWVIATNEAPMMCGMNVCFDRDFVRFACERAGIKTPFGYRTVDVHAVAWYYITKLGSRPPKNLSLNRILEMLGAGTEPEPHNALTGAMCSAECLSRMLSGKTLFPGTEFNK
jgi:DNA polymerase III epsilon subunit-like protein